MISKVILSRKGFDSQAGGKPSPIYKNKFCSIPIPEVNSGINYDDLIFEPGASYLKLLLDLDVNYFTECHLDPDINPDLIKRPDWRPIFGQSDGAATRLKEVGKDSLFLFYGWFKEIEKVNGTYRYIKEAPDIHCIFGYMMVDKVLSNPQDREQIKLLNHPHARSSPYKKQDYLNNLKNRLFVGKEQSSDLNKRAYGNFIFDEKLVLTDKNFKSRSIWRLPKFFLNEPFNGYSIESNNGECITIKFTGRNHQELIVSESKEIKDWAINLINISAIY